MHYDPPGSLSEICEPPARPPHGSCNARYPAIEGNYGRYDISNRVMLGARQSRLASDRLRFTGVRVLSITAAGGATRPDYSDTRLSPRDKRAAPSRGRAYAIHRKFAIISEWGPVPFASRGRWLEMAIANAYGAPARISRTQVEGWSMLPRYSRPPDPSRPALLRRGAEMSEARAQLSIRRRRNNEEAMLTQQAAVCNI